MEALRIMCFILCGYLSFGYQQADERGRELFTIAFNRKIQPASGVSLHSFVLIATYGDVFKPLSPNDEVYIKDNYVFIKPEKAYLGVSFDFKLAAGTVETVDTQERNREAATARRESSALCHLVGMKQCFLFL